MPDDDSGRGFGPGPGPEVSNCAGGNGAENMEKEMQEISIKSRRESVFEAFICDRDREFRIEIELSGSRNASASGGSKNEFGNFGSDFKIGHKSFDSDLDEFERVYSAARAWLNSYDEAIEKLEEKLFSSEFEDCLVDEFEEFFFKNCPDFFSKKSISFAQIYNIAIGALDRSLSESDDADADADALLSQDQRSRLLEISLRAAIEGMERQM
ncbi:hypothetical protein [Parvibaculum sp.]|uniref:hypothetical protein n=1 Tax=Parvibaculum sp. TaxID=2024848 RepID=UPI0032117487